MKENTHLPTIGVGPIYVISIVALTVIAVILQQRHWLLEWRVPVLKMPFIILGIIFIALGCFFYLSALFQSHIDKHIINNQLVTTGVYAYVRNPISFAFMIACIGVLLFFNNLFLLLFGIVYWLWMTILMKLTEEKWLKALYGKEYEDYCQRVNRCIPFIKWRK